VVVDKAGNVAASVRGDGTNPHTMEFGRLKAYTARTRGQTSLEFKNLTDKPETAYLKQIPNVVAVGGGVPIKAGNEVIGAVGVSGAPGGEKDEVCANAGIAKVSASLAVGGCASRQVRLAFPTAKRSFPDPHSRHYDRLTMSRRLRVCALLRSQERLR
jgi:uncharacterized protein GlcG (DUF336 family)